MSARERDEDPAGLPAETRANGILGTLQREARADHRRELEAALADMLEQTRESDRRVLGAVERPGQHLFLVRERERVELQPGAGRRHPDRYHRSSAARRTDREIERRGPAHRVECDVNFERRLVWVERGGRAETKRLLAPGCDGVDGDDLRGPRDAGALDDELADERLAPQGFFARTGGDVLASALGFTWSGVTFPGGAR